MRPTIIALLMGIFVFAGAGPAFACKCKVVSHAEAYDSAKVVFYGEVIEVSSEEVKLKVSKAYKKTKRKKKITIVQSESNCDLAFQEGEKYMVYASKSGKKTYSAGRCSGSTKLDYTPISGVVWTLADRPTYGVTKKNIKKQDNARNKMSDHAMKALRTAVKNCDKGIWKSKENVMGHIEVRFDRVKGRMFDAQVLRYDTQAGMVEVTDSPVDVVAETKVKTERDSARECINEKLTQVKFPKHSGGPFSVYAYLLLDQIDPMMARKKGSAQVVEFKATKFD